MSLVQPSPSRERMNMLLPVEMRIDSAASGIRAVFNIIQGSGTGDFDFLSVAS